jgi:hypothetical protein
MSYQEREIPKENLEKILRVLDSDEGIRIDEEGLHIFVNKTSKRYCIAISRDNKDEFIYKSSVEEVISLLQNYLRLTSKIVAY